MNPQIGGSVNPLALIGQLYLETLLLKAKVAEMEKTLQAEKDARLALLREQTQGDAS
jgi:hypothetical protein